MFGAAKTILLMSVAVFFTFDFSGYVFAWMMQRPDLGIGFPEGYHYGHWLREPLALKWQVLGFLPIIRYLPILFALCAGGAVQVFLWKITFREGLLVFVSLVVLTVIAMALLSLVFSFGVGIYEGVTGDEASRRSAGQEPGRKAGSKPDRRAAGKTDGRARKQRANQPAVPPPAPAGRPTSLAQLQERVANVGAAQGPWVRRVHSWWEPINQRFDPLYRVIHPVTRYLPSPVQSFVHGGGWVLIVAGVLGGLFVWRRGRRRPEVAVQ
jgi:hypothetical protein